MNMFRPVSCMNLKDENIEDVLGASVISSPSYDGPIVILENIDISSLFLFFPVTKKDMNLINKTMSGSMDIKALSIYNTLMYSWRSTGFYLSGLIMDLTYDLKSSKNKVVVQFALSDSEGQLITLVPVSFTDAMIISIIAEQDVMVRKGILDLMIPNPECGDECGDECHCQDQSKTGEGYPLEHDDNLRGIVKDILEGKTKDKDKDEDEDDPDNSDNSDNSDK